jgi:hypothetical protein
MNLVRPERLMFRNPNSKDSTRTLTAKSGTGHSDSFQNHNFLRDEERS